MRFTTLLAVALIVSLSSVAFAELQNVEVGGSIRIRGNYFNMEDSLRTSFIEQRTRLNVKADFTQDVSAFVEFDYYDNWGEDFRSNYLTGADVRAGLNDVELYQGYIEARCLWGTQLSARVGRQELALGNQWLVGVNDASSFFTGLSFDALRLTYATDVVSVDVIAAKLVETFSDFGDNDVDLYAVYGSYTGMEDITLDAYWMYVRDDFGVNGILKNDLHTVGLRGAGVVGGFDFDLEAAYQFGEVDVARRRGWFRDRIISVDNNEFAVNAEAGYTFDMNMQPRIFARFAYLGGGGNGDMPFNRLFSNVEYSEFLDNLNGAALSNVLFYSVGVQALVTETLEMKLVGSYLTVDEEIANVGKGLGWEVALYADYHYSEDLVVRAGYAHFFGKDGLGAAAVACNGLVLWPGTSDDDYDYVFIETEISF